MFLVTYKGGIGAENELQSEFGRMKDWAEAPHQHIIWYCSMMSMSRPKSSRFTKSQKTMNRIKSFITVVQPKGFDYEAAHNCLQPKYLVTEMRNPSDTFQMINDLKPRYSCLWVNCMAITLYPSKDGLSIRWCRIYNLGICFTVMLKDNISCLLKS